MDGAITIKQLLEIVPLSEWTIWNLEKNGDFPARFKFCNGTVAWSRNKVESWLDEREMNPAQRDPSLAAKFEANPNHRKAAERSAMRMAV